MKQLKNDPSQRPLKKFYYGSLIILLLSLLISSFVISSIFVKKEKIRSEIMLQNISQTFDSEYRYIVEEFFTTSYDSIFIRVKNTLQKFGNKNFKVYLYNKNGECTFSKDQDQQNISCEKYPYRDSFENTNVQANIIGNELQLYTPLFLSTENIGHLLIKVEDNNHFFNIDTFSFIISNYLPLFIAVIFCWLAWLFYSRKYILWPYLNNIFKKQNEKISSSVLSQIVHDTRGDIESLEAIGGEISQSDKSNGEQILTLVKNLKESLDQFDSEPSKNNLHLEDVSFNQFIKENQKRVFSRYGSQAGIEIKYLLDNILHKKLIFKINSTRLHRSILNLIQNAIEAVPNKRKCNLELSFEYNSKNLIIKVSDNGKGIPKNINPFSRDYSTKEMKGGSGLYFTRKAILEMNGEISYVSDSSGTTFSLILPAIKQKLIILEDNLEKAERYKKTLSNKNIYHEVFTNPEDLISSSKGFNLVDFFVLDHDLNSKITGLDVAKRLHENGFQNLYIRSGNTNLKKESYPLIKDVLERKSVLDLVNFFINSI